MLNIVEIRTFLLPVQTRVPLKFGHETLTSVSCLRVEMTVEDAAGRRATGVGETPLSVQWGWPSPLPYGQRYDAMVRLSQRLATAWQAFGPVVHPLDFGFRFQREAMPDVAVGAAVDIPDGEPIPHLAALIVCSAFDIALHDAFGMIHDVDVYQTYGGEFMPHDLTAYLEPVEGSDISFQGLFPEGFLNSKPPARLPVWHLVGGLDPLEADDQTEERPADDYPVTLREWIRTDGLKCLKIKLRGNDREWDYQRLLQVGRIAIEEDARWLSTDFNCTVYDPAYVNDILDQLRDESARIYGMILYVEQPFPYDLAKHRIDTHSLSARKPLFLDESAHDWSYVRLGRQLGWSGVALKTCKTQTGALLSLCWAKAHGMPLMVQDLTNPMLAMIPHVRLAAAADTIMGVECNAMQFYPAASQVEAAVHPGLYLRRGGEVDLSTLGGPGFGYRLDQIKRDLPAADFVAESG